MSSDHELSRDSEIDLGGILASIWHQKARILMVGLLAGVLAYFVVNTIEPRYKSQTSILIQNSDAVLTRNSESPSAQNSRPIDEQTIASQVELLQSRAIARKVIKELKLLEKPEFDFSRETSTLKRFLGLIGLSEDGSQVSAQDRVLEAFYDRLNVYQLNRARMIIIEFWSHDPELTALVPNAIAKEHVRLQEELTRGANPADLAQLEPELDLQRKKVLDAEDRIAQYRASTGLFTGKDKTSLAGQELADLTTELSSLRVQLSRSRANSQAVQRAVSTGTLGSAISILKSPLVQRLREQQINLNTQLADLNIKLLPKHPKIQGVKSQLATVSKQLKAEMRKVLSSLKQQVRIDEDRQKDLLQRRNVLKSQVAEEEKETVQLRALQREADAEGQLLNAYLIRFKEAKSRQSRDFLPADAKIISTASASSKAYFPKKAPIIIASAMGAMMLASRMVLLTHALGSNKTQKTRTGIFAKFGKTKSEQMARQDVLEAKIAHLEQVAQLGATPGVQRTNYNPNLVVPPMMPDLLSPAAINIDPVDMMMVAKSMAGMEKARVAVVSVSQDSLSGSAIALARLLASVGSTVLIDLRGDALATRNMLGNNPANGVKDLLAGNCLIENALHIDQISGAHIIPTGNSTAQLTAGSAQALPAILNRLEQAYRYVIIDAGIANPASIRHIKNSTTGIIINAGGDGAMSRNFLQAFKDQGQPLPVIMGMSVDATRVVGLTA